MNKKALIAMSGGVDSSVSALMMLEQGYECTGVTMKLFANEDIGVSKANSCCSIDDVADARSVATSLGMPYYVFNFADRFERDVIGRYLLRKAVDPLKDQSYVLYSLTQEQLAHAMFPLGGLHKTQVREIAEKHGFVNAQKHDSQDICFIQTGTYADFIEARLGRKFKPGNFVDEAGNVLGRHKGIIHYTVGQRKGLGLALPQPMYVKEIDTKNNAVILTTNEGLFTKNVTAKNINLIDCDAITEPRRVKARIRYHQQEQWATVTQPDADTLQLVFDEPQRAITKGQSVVMYDGDVVVGGGTIV